jgi:hypothetical protein
VRVVFLVHELGPVPVCMWYSLRVNWAQCLYACDVHCVWNGSSACMHVTFDMREMHPVPICMWWSLCVKWVHCMWSLLCVQWAQCLQCSLCVQWAQCLYACDIHFAWNGRSACTHVMFIACEIALVPVCMWCSLSVKRVQCRYACYVYCEWNRPSACMCIVQGSLSISSPLNVLRFF